jgi:hypothetical protein
MAAGRGIAVAVKVTSLIAEKYREPLLVGMLPKKVQNGNGSSMVAKEESRA